VELKTPSEKKGVFMIKTGEHNKEKLIKEAKLEKES